MSVDGGLVEPSTVDPQSNATVDGKYHYFVKKIWTFFPTVFCSTSSNFRSSIYDAGDRTIILSHLSRAIKIAYIDPLSLVLWHGIESLSSIFSPLHWSVMLLLFGLLGATCGHVLGLV